MTADPAWTREQHNAIAAFLVSRCGRHLSEATALATEMLDAAYEQPTPSGEKPQPNQSEAA